MGCDLRSDRGKSPVNRDSQGGIHERRGEFSVEHNEFWLFPTRFHEGEQDLTEEGRRLLHLARQKQPAQGFIELTTYFEVTDVVEIGREEQLPALRPFHVYDDRVLSQRFNYKMPGLTVLVGRASVRVEPHTLCDSPHFGGCRSWVDLPTALSTEGLTSVLDHDAFSRRREQVLSLLQRRRVL